MKSILVSLLLLVSICSFAPIPEIESENGNRFAFSMMQMLSQENKSNFVFSPYGLRNCFAYVYAGADENTKDQIQQTFLFYKDPEKELKAYQASNSIFESCSEKVKIANSMWIREDAAPIKQPYLDLTKKYTDAVKTLENTSQVNNWVSKKTDGQIKELVTEDEMADIKLLMLNALTLDAQWKSPFEERDTYNGDFYVDKKSIKVPTMSGSVRGRCFEDETMTLIQLPYTGSLSMTIVMPEKENFVLTLDEKMQKRLKGDMDLYGDLKLWKGDYNFFLHLPKFKQATTLNMIPTLLKLGVTDAFEGGKANFYKMNSLLYLKLVKQKAVVEVMESGTKAAAATAIGSVERGMPPTYKINKPFYFIIHHHKTGEILFMGKMVKPGL